MRLNRHPRISKSTPKPKTSDDHLPELILGKSENGFGDTLANLSYLIKHTPGPNVYISKHIPRHQKVKIENIWPAIRTNKNVVWTEEKGNLVKKGVYSFAESYVPMKYMWKKRTFKKLKIAYQFKTPSNVMLEKRLTNDEEIYFLNWFKSFDVVEINKKYSVLECTRILSECTFFVGICSGMSHLAHACGTPVFLKDYVNGRGHTLDRFHPCKDFVAFDTARDAIIKIKDFVKRERSYEVK